MLSDWSETQSWQGQRCQNLGGLASESGLITLEGRDCLEAGETD